MGYEDALKAAGAKILAIKHFGTYQGDIWAKVRYKGRAGWVCIAYGSCSGCDEYEAALGWPVNPTTKQLAEFGGRYLDEIMTQKKAEKLAAKYTRWDMNAADALKFIRDNAKTKKRIAAED